MIISLTPKSNLFNKIKMMTSLPDWGCNWTAENPDLDLVPSKSATISPVSLVLICSSKATYIGLVGHLGGGI